MVFRIIWSDFAITQLEEIYSYYEKNESSRIAKRIVVDIVKAPNKLMDAPYIGREEGFLNHRKTTYRFLVFKNYKIIYSVDEDNNYIKIADVFHTRQDPSKVQRSI